MSPVYMNALLFPNCAELWCIRCTIPPHDILVTYAGIEKRDSRGRTASASTELNDQHIHHFTTTFSITFANEQRKQKNLLSHLKIRITNSHMKDTEQALMNLLPQGIATISTAADRLATPPFQRPSKKRTNASTGGLQNPLSRKTPPTEPPTEVNRSRKKHKEQLRCRSEDRNERKLFRALTKDAETSATRVSSPPPHYSEIEPRLTNLNIRTPAQTRFQTHFGTHLLKLTTRLGSTKYLTQAKRCAKLIERIIELTITNFVLRMETSLQKQCLRLEKEKSILTNLSNNVHCTKESQPTMSSYSYPSVGATPDPNPVTTATEHDATDPDDGYVAPSESEFQHGDTSLETQPVKRKPFNTNDAPTFHGPNVTEFLEAFEDYCRDRAIPLNECIPRISRLCIDEDIKETIEELPSFTGRDWKTFRKALLEEFEDIDPKQLRNTADYLRTLVITDDITADKLDSFCNKWDAARKSLLGKGKRSEAELTLILVSALPKKLLERAIIGAELDRAKMDTLRTERPLANLRKEAERRRCIEKIQPEALKKDRKVSFVKPLGLTPATLHPALRSAAQQVPPKPSALANPLPPAFRNPNQRTSPGPIEMDELTKQFAAITMSFEQFGKVMEQLPANIRQVIVTSLPNSVGNNQQQYQRPQPAQNPNQGPYQNAPRFQGTQTGYNAPASSAPAGYANQNNLNTAPDRPCVYCGVMGHFKAACTVMWNDIRANKIHLIEGRVHDGAPGEGGQAIDVRGTSGVGMRVRVTAFQKPGEGPAPMIASSSTLTAMLPEDDYPDQFSVSSNSITVMMPSNDHSIHLPPNYSSDSDSDNSVAPEVSVRATRVEKKRNEDSFHSQTAKEALRKRAAKEAKLPTTKNKLSNGGWKPAVEATHGEEMVMDETEHTPNKPLAKAPPKAKAAGSTPKTATKQTWLQSQLVDHNAETFLKTVMKGAKIDLSMWDLLSASPTLQDLIFKKYLVPIGNPTARSLQEAPLVARSNLIHVTEDGDVTYLEDCPKISVRLGGDQASQIALLDSGAECNVITTGLVDAHSLPTSLGTRLLMKSHTGHIKKFVGVAENVLIKVGSISVEGHFFIIEDAQQEVVLGNPYLKAARLSFRYDSVGNQWATVCDKEGDEVEVLVSKPRSTDRKARELRVIRGKGQQD